MSFTGKEASIIPAYRLDKKNHGGECARDRAYYVVQFFQRCVIPKSRALTSGTRDLA
jgi:hypothetical protein